MPFEMAEGDVTRRRITDIANLIAYKFSFSSQSCNKRGKTQTHSIYDNTSVSTVK